MHADQAAGVSTGAASLFAEARSESAIMKRQIGGLKNLAGMQIGKLNLGGGDHIQALAGVEHVLLKLGKLTGARHGLLVGHGR